MALPDQDDTPICTAMVQECRQRCIEGGIFPSTLHAPADFQRDLMAEQGLKSLPFWMGMRVITVKAHLVAVSGRDLSVPIAALEQFVEEKKAEDPLKAPKVGQPCPLCGAATLIFDCTSHCSAMCGWDGQTPPDEDQPGLPGMQ